MLPARHTDPVSSKRNTCDTAKHRAIIVEVLKQAAIPLTSREIADRCELDYYQVARRMHEIKEVKKAGFKLCGVSKSSKPVIAWYL